MELSVVQGRTITLRVEWYDFPGGPASVVTGVTVEITPAGGGDAVVGPTSTGVVHVVTGLDTYTWTVPAGQAPGDYVVIWRGTDAQGDQVTATDIVTVADLPPAGAYASITDLTAKLGRTPINAAQLLVRASRDVDRALLCERYDIADPAIVATLRDTTLEQVAAELDSKKRAGGFSIGRLAVQARSRDAEEAPRKIGPLWEPAWNILQAAGLTGHGPQVW